MTIEEGIEFFEDIARLEYDLVDSYHTDEGVYGKEESYHREKAEHHEQVAMWLKELKAYREAWYGMKEELLEMSRLQEYVSIKHMIQLIDKVRPKDGDTE